VKERRKGKSNAPFHTSSVLLTEGDDPVDYLMESAEKRKTRKGKKKKGPVSSGQAFSRKKREEKEKNVNAISPGTLYRYLFVRGDQEKDVTRSQHARETERRGRERRTYPGEILFAIELK